MGLLMLPALALLTLASAWAVSFSLFWLFALVPFALLLALGIHDVVQRRRSKRYRALDVPDKATRVQRFQSATVAEAQQLIAAMGLTGPHELRPEMVHRRVSQRKTSSYAELYDYLKPGELLGGPVEGWDADWLGADPDTFRAVGVKEG